MAHNSNGYSRSSGGVTRILGILGFIAILGIGMWGAVMIARAVPGAFSNLGASIASLSSVFIAADNGITLEATPSTANPGQPIALNFTHDKKNTDGSYTFRYDCADSVYFVAPSPSGSQIVYCNTSFHFLNNGNTFPVTGFSAASSSIQTMVYIDYTQNGASKSSASGSVKVTIQGNASTTPNPGTPTTTPTTPKPPVTVPPTPTAPGYVDLAVQVLSIGTQDRNTGVFYANPTPSRRERMAVRFSIQNIGTEVSPSFDFAAVLPTNPQQNYVSSPQTPLRPGERIEFTLAFESFTPNTSVADIKITVDPNQRVTEKEEVNNAVTYRITTNP